MSVFEPSRFFSTLTPIRRSYPYLTKDEDVDAVVVGGGVVGALVANALTDAGIVTALTEQSAAGYGLSGVTAPVMLYDGETSLSKLIPKLGLRAAVDAMHTMSRAANALGALLGQAQADVRFAYKKGVLAVEDADRLPSLRAEYELRARNGFDVAFLDKAAAGSKYAFPIEGAILSGEGCAQADPYRLTGWLLDRAANNGLQVYENTRILRMQPLPDSVLLHTKLGKTIRTRHVVFCAGAVSSLGAEGCKNAARTYGVATQPFGAVDGWQETAILRTDSGETLLDFENRALLFSGDLPLLLKKRLFGGAPLKSVATLRWAALQERVAELLPLTQNVPNVNARFEGVVMRTGGLPHLAPMKSAPRVFLCTGYGHNALLAGVLAGDLAAAWIHGQQPDYASSFAQ